MSDPASPLPNDALPAPTPAVRPGRSPLVALLADPMEVPAFRPDPSDRAWRWGTLLAVFGLYLLNAGSFGLWDPWETHYGEVTRYMVETWDWVNPWWGYQRKIGTEPIGGEWFYSKPVYIFWAEATFIKLIGLTDWALRLPIALLGASMCASVYLAVERILSRRQAFWATVVTALSPFVYMVSRQAQTDMPFVATMTIGLMLLLVAILGKRPVLTHRGFWWATAGFSVFLLANLVPQLAIISTDLYDASEGQGLAHRIQQNGIFHAAIYAPIGLGILASVLVPIWRKSRTAEGFDEAFVDRQIRRFWLLSAYMLMAQATYAKGLLGFLLPGAILGLYVAVSRGWRLLGRLELVRGVPLFFVTVLPWYVAMFARHGMPYYQRFFIHDHFNRVGAGVHQIDTGTFEYFVEWLGYGLFPWSIFAPLAVLAGLGWVKAERPEGPNLEGVFDDRSPDAFRSQALSQLRVFALLWFSFAFFLFTLSSTRFHHYILPGVPAIAMLTGLYLEELRRDDRLPARAAVGIAAVLLVALLVNLMGDYQNLRNLFTYKYDRPMPENLPIDWSASVVWNSDTAPITTWADTTFAKHVGPMVANVLAIKWFRFDTFWPVVGVLCGLAVLLMLAAPTSASRFTLRGLGLGLLTATAGLIAFWALNWYMPTLAPHWSQKYLFEAYYSDCHRHPNPPPIEEAFTPLVRRAGLDFVADFFEAVPKRVCQEDIVSWLITWRGETYYSNNEIRPLNKATQLGPYLQEMNRGKTFYALLERGRLGGFASKLDAESKKLRSDGDARFADVQDWNCELIHNESAYFVLAKCVPSSQPAAGGAPGKAGDPQRPRRPSRVIGPQTPPSDRPSSPNPSF